MNEEIKHINQREDIDIDLTIYKKDGTVLDMSAAPRAYVIIHDGYGMVYAKFKKGAPAAGWYVMDTSQDNVGILSFSIFSEVTKLMPPGHYYAEFSVRFNSTIHTDDNFFDVEEVKQYLFSIKESQINKLASLPA